MENPAPPIILIIAGHPPSGTAGIQADIELAQSAEIAASDYIALGAFYPTK
jgi:hydroxymethylpyrimidine/phosphomethylpyrimidine kinase